MEILDSCKNKIVNPYKKKAKAFLVFIDTPEKWASLHLMMALKLGNFFEPDFNEILPVANFKKCYKIIV